MRVDPPPGDRIPSALIVGGGGAIGSATARLMLGDGYQVALAGRSMEALQARRDQLPNPANVSCHSFDASDWQATRDAIARAARQLGGLDTVVNAAGVFMDP